MDNKIDIISADSFIDIDKVIRLHKTIWGLTNLEITPSHIYIATNHAGGHTLIAYLNDIPVGYIYGFPGRDAQHKTFFYIHNIGILEAYRSLGIGLQLMLELRKRLIENDYHLVKWTFDPLETLNASLYIGKLGGITNDYIPEYYGEMNDSINRGLPSDRLNLYWHIKSKHVFEKLAQITKRKTLEVNPKLCLNRIGENNDTEDLNAPSKQQNYFLQLPTNYHDLKEKSENATYKWRINIRKHMQKAFAEGLYITDTLYSQNRFFYLLSKSP